jgi:hypothetical protein
LIDHDWAVEVGVEQLTEKVAAQVVQVVATMPAEVRARAAAERYTDQMPRRVA